MKKKLLVFLAFIIVLDIVALGVMYFTRDIERAPVNATVPDVTSVQETAPPTTQQELFSRVSFVAVGDNLIHDTVYEQAQARSSTE